MSNYFEMLKSAALFGGKSGGGGGGGNTYDMTNLTWVNKNGNDSTGEWTSDMDFRLACEEYVPIPDGKTGLRIEALESNNSEFMFYIYFYSDSAYLGFVDWVRSSETVSEILTGATRFRICMSDFNAKSLTTEDIKSVTAYFT